MPDNRKVRISADFEKITGKIKPMHAVGQPPMSLWQVRTDHFHYLTEANIPYSRLHDMGGRYGAGVYVDIPNIFRNFDADENDPASYDFTMTDRLLTGLADAGVEPFYRLGVTIENDASIKYFRITPPADFHKWARICEHIVRHYNEGWADGYTLGIRYWEIWNEPEGDILDVRSNCMWRGSAEEYFRLYEICAKHLKNCFGDSISVGGYASCGFYGCDADPEGTGLCEAPKNVYEGFIDFFHRFLAYISSEEHKAPLDFFSWHSYATVAETVKHERYCRKVLEKYGFGSVPDFLDEWNTCHDDERFYHGAAAKALGMMLAMQKEKIAMLNFYDASMGLMTYSGLFNGETHKPYPTYFAFMSFGNLYRLGCECESSSDNDAVYVCAGCGKGRGTLLIANLNEAATEAEIAVSGIADGDHEILSIDDTYTYSPTGRKIKDGKLILPAMSCTEIRFSTL